MKNSVSFSAKFKKTSRENYVAAEENVGAAGPRKHSEKTVAIFIESFRFEKFTR